MLNHFKTSDGIRIGYHIDDFSDPWRHDPPLIMLHSGMGHSRRFYAMVPTLSRHFCTIRLDLRGHGTSDVPADKSVRMERLVDDVIELMAELGISSAHFLGNSAGGYISQQLAMKHPEKVLSLTLFGSTPGLKNSQALTWLPRVAKEGLRAFLADTVADRFPLAVVDPGLVTWFLDEAAKNDAQYIGNFVSHMASLEWSDQLDRIRCPTFVGIPVPRRSGIPATTMPCATISPTSRSNITTACLITSATAFQSAAPQTHWNSYRAAFHSLLLASARRARDMRRLQRRRMAEPRSRVVMLHLRARLRVCGWCVENLFEALVVKGAIFLLHIGRDGLARPPAP
jgi:3-oxoadipate enol-lactonase